MGNEGYVPLFETKHFKGRFLYRAFAASIWVAISTVLIYRVTQAPPRVDDRVSARWWGWMVVFGAELWFSFYWVLTQSFRWKLVYRSTFKDSLSLRYEKELPKVDIFVCTADADIEPPVMVINTVLSVMAYDYPPEKLSIYLSDDGGSHLTFYALWEASHFCKHWLPFSRKFHIEPRSPEAYFTSSMPSPVKAHHATSFASIKKLYEDMKNRIENATRLGRIPEDVRVKHKGFSQWDNYTSKYDHDTILQIMIDGRNPEERDVEGCALPTLVYLAREKRPQHFHHFKAGAMNTLIRVSSKISNAPIILNVDCDMYSNNSLSIRDALCFFMDERQSHQIAFVQFPQKFANVTKNEIYGASLRVISEVEFHGMDGLGGPLYVGSGCFHRRDILCGKKFSEDCEALEWMKAKEAEIDASVEELEENTKGLASSTYDLKHSQWGKEMGLKYGCAVEDVITGLAIQCRGWKSVYCNPERPSFLGVAPTTLADTLVQHKRWSEGELHIMLYNCPLCYGFRRISLGLQLCYSHYCLWSCNSYAMLVYCTVPSLYLLKGIPLFPELTSSWILPFAYIIITKYTYSLGEFLWSGGTLQGWWNEQRIWLYKRISSYLFALLDTLLKLAGISEMNFIITAKVAADEEASRRYENDMVEFGAETPMFTILATVGLLNLFCFVVAVAHRGVVAVAEMGVQVVLCGVLVVNNLPLYVGMFVRKDKGRMPSSVTLKAATLAAFVCVAFLLFFRT